MAHGVQVLDPYSPEKTYTGIRSGVQLYMDLIGSDMEPVVNWAQRRFLSFISSWALAETVSAGPSFTALKYPSKIQVVHIEFKLVLKEYTVGLMCIIYGLLSSPVRISGFTHATQGLHPWNGN